MKFSRTNFKLQRFESRSPRLESWRISIPECGGSKMRSQAALAHALIGVKVINLLIAKHEYLRSSVATCARPIGFMLDPANQCHLGCPSCVNSYNTKVTNYSARRDAEQKK